MSSSHKQLPLDKLFAFLRDENLTLDSNELSFQILEANKQKNNVAPPAHIRETLRQKIAAQSTSASKPSTWRRWFDLSLMPPRIAFATAMLALAITSTILLIPKGEPKPLQLAAQASSGLISLNERQTLIDAGLEMSASQKSAIFLQQGKNNHLFIKTGTVRINIDHRRITKEPYFHTLHGSIISEGTAFTIHTSADATRIVLHEGKIGVYTDIDGAMKKATYSAPADFILTQRTLTGNDNPNFTQFEDKVAQQKKNALNSNLKNPSHSAPTQRKVTLILKNGDNLSGVIEKSDATHIYLRNPRGLLKIPKSDINKEL